ncbi:TIGR00282 family metallophosphoesterase [Candidatus Saganbacteria bacterium CG08_land_8_20_14_0_20_45_16]|uniref:TIGR00282 family metallophosphoesterase n=1 Tax=Candidatus Saganbacteria bacterium CG08_land_8_20_14_0_20_45_16 TaxID=2014293 RepID=A0A2H0Y368_UNCSA|nr:MAG: TIGR00282 family metallophosphoesterase [Candidatus Saganbacteria bacterium CG08_land_8_20_14_0_20_45_16]
MKILFIGDIIGKLGRAVCRELIPQLKTELGFDLVIANGENSAHGYSITEAVYQELLRAGIEAISMGNHIWDKKELIKNIDHLPLMVKPANYPPGTPGQDHLIIERNNVKTALINLAGRTFMSALDCPFRKADELLSCIKADIIIVDIHAEATSEKNAIGCYLDGRVSAVLGTHTHVMTADERVLPQGTAYITDIGMCGAVDSIIGMNKEQILKRFLTALPEKFQPVEKGAGIFNAVLLEIDNKTGQAHNIIRVQRTI